MKNYALGALCLALLALAAFGALSLQRAPAEALPIAMDSGSPNAAMDMHAALRDLGPDAAYRKLLGATASSTESIKHLNGHLFGGALYDVAGLPGFSACGMELNGGCLHEFVARAIQDSGLPIIGTLSEDCIGRFGLMGATACQHGIGHGLVGYLGYTDAALEDSLEACATLTAANPVRGCYGGAFMEFTTRTMAENVLLEFSTAAPFSHCAKVSDAFRPACYFWTPTWALESLFGATRDRETYAAVGALCAKAPEAYASSCYGGLGYFAPPSAGFDREKTEALCDSVSSAPEPRAACWEVAKEAVGAEAAPLE